MPKSFKTVVTQATKKMYSKRAMFNVIMAKMNTAARLVRIGSPNGTAGDITKSVQYNVQVMLRPTGVKVVQNPNSGSTSDALALLDSFEKSEWETINVVSGTLKSLGFKRTINDDFNMDDLKSIHIEETRRRVNEIAIDRKNTVYGLISANAKKTGTTYKITKQDRVTQVDVIVPDLKAYAEGKTEVWESLAAAINLFSKIDDKFQTVADPEDTIVSVSSDVATHLALEMGKSFNSENPIAQTGFTTGMGVNGTPVVVDHDLPANTARLINKNALIFTKDKIDKQVNQQLGLTQYVGEAFYDVFAVADEARIWEITKAPIVKRTGTSNEPIKTVDYSAEVIDGLSETELDELIILENISLASDLTLEQRYTEVKKALGV